MLNERAHARCKDYAFMLVGFKSMLPVEEYILFFVVRSPNFTAHQGDKHRSILLPAKIGKPTNKIIHTTFSLRNFSRKLTLSHTCTIAK